MNLNFTVHYVPIGTILISAGLFTYFILCEICFFSSISLIFTGTKITAPNPNQIYSKHEISQAALHIVVSDANLLPSGFAGINTRVLLSFFLPVLRLLYILTIYSEQKRHQGFMI